MTLTRAFCLFIVAVEMGYAARLDAGAGEESWITIEAAESTNSTESTSFGKSGCDNEQVNRDVWSRCVLPGQINRATITCWGCLFYKRDAHPNCEIPCCDRDQPVYKGMFCQCTPTGQKYNKGWGGHVVHGNDAAKCCGTGHQSGERCGCSDLGQIVRFGGEARRDCCSHQWNHERKCVKRTCAKKNTEGDCCRTSDGEAPKNGNKCGCFHANKSPHRLDDVDGSNCCSGSMDGSNQKCACISDPSTPLPEGANEDDCCSGATEKHDGAEYCRAAKCSEVGSPKSHGQFCCSGKDSGGKCVCVPVGDEAPEHERDCCSGRKEDGKCVRLGKGAMPNLILTDESVCLSGEVDDEGRCSCFHGGSQSTDVVQCCSEEHVKDSDTCSCVHATMDLVNGAKESDCCSGTLEDDGTCGCISGHTTPLKVGVSASDCCTGETEDRGGQTYCRPAYCSRALLSLTNVSENNLGRQGPDDDEYGQTLVFLDVFPDLDGRTINLVISNTTEYVPKRSKRNGVKEGEAFGVLNVKSGTEVGLRFDFVNAATGAVEVIPNFLFSFLDLDTGKEGTGAEYVKVMGYTGYKMAENSIVDAKPVDTHSGYFYGTQHKFGYEDPDDLRNMTEQQTQRLVSFEFPSSSGFDIVLGASEGSGGRNVYFGGASQLYCGPRGK